MRQKCVEFREKRRSEVNISSMTITVSAFRGGVVDTELESGRGSFRWKSYWLKIGLCTVREGLYGDQADLKLTSKFQKLS